jgi:proteasome lid subunit RPN8/RPN11
MAWQRAAGSIEVCALCAVDHFGAQHLLRLTNHAGLIGSFEVSRTEEQIARTVAAEQGWKIVAFVHTHPQYAPEMSPRDARTFKRDTLPWIIIATQASDPAQRTYIERS